MPLPGFLTAMFVGILITNGCDLAKVELDKPSISLCSDVSLQLFLAMSLMSLAVVDAGGSVRTAADYLARSDCGDGDASLVSSFSRRWGVTTTRQ